MNQELKDIYIEIAKGITHQYEDDIKYIMEQIERYKDHPKSTELIRNIGMLYYDLLPEGNKQDLSKVIALDQANVGLLFYIAQYLVAQREIEKAYDIMKVLISEIETLNLSPDSAVLYFSFDSMLQLFLYAQEAEPTKEIKQTDLPLSGMYRAYANILYRKEQYQEAKQQLEIAHRWNPVDVDIMFDQAEVYKATNELELFFETSKEALKFVHELPKLAKCYRNIGYYFLQEGVFDVAVTSYYMSLVFDKSELALKALYSVYEITKKELNTPELEDMKIVLEANKIQVGSSILVVDTILQLAKEYDELQQRDVAIQYLSMAHQLTNDDSLLKVIEDMKQSIEGEDLPS